MSNGATPVLVDGARTPIGKLNGALSPLSGVELGALAVAGALERSPGLVPDYAILGNVLQAGNGQNPARQAVIGGGAPATIPGVTLNDVCLASMTATSLAALLVTTGRATTVLVGGFDSMTRAPHAAWMRGGIPVGDIPLVDLMVRDGLWCAFDRCGMGELSDRENARLGIARAEQDAFAARSQQRAAAASERLATEIVPVNTAGHVVDADEGIRPDTNVAKLRGLLPAFDPAGTITAGSSSQLSDAGAAGIVTTLDTAKAAGRQPLVEIVDHAIVAGPDPTLHLKPARAARVLLERHRIQPKDVGLWEINEAFAGVVVATMRDLEIDPDCVNVNGGAIALGHPLGASGFRLLLTLAYEMRRRSIELGVAAICGGGGQGEAVLLRLV